nr:hypothetical protein [Tanacetum cinerariifolium]
SGLVTEGPTIPNPPKPVNPEEDECVEEQDSFPSCIPYPSRMLKQKQQEKDDIQIQKFWNMFKQLHLNITPAEALRSKLRDPGKFLIPCGFSELKCKALADLGASINLTPLSVWKKLGLPDLIPTQMTLELANHAICTPEGIARDVFVPVEIASLEVIPEFHDSKGFFLSEELPDIDSFNEFHPYFDDDSFDSEGEKIKEAELLIAPLDLPCDILSEYDSFNS